MRIKTVTVAGLAALILAACGQGDDKAADARATDERATGERPAAPVVPASAPGRMDTPKPGLWRITTRMSGMPEGMATPSVETCMRQESFADLRRGPDGRAPEGVRCGEQTFRREGNAMVGHSVCDMPNGVRAVSDTRVTGDFDRRYTMEVKTRMTPAPAPSMAETTMTVTAERIGDC